VPRDEFGKVRMLTTDECVEAVRLYVVEKMSLNEAARELDCDPTMVLKVLKRHDIPRRTYREWLDIKRAEERRRVQELLGGTS
jgi:predicted HTH domain antitoxin